MLKQSLSILIRHNEVVTRGGLCLLLSRIFLLYPLKWTTLADPSIGSYSTFIANVVPAWSFIFIAFKYSLLSIFLSNDIPSGKWTPSLVPHNFFMDLKRCFSQIFSKVSSCICINIMVKCSRNISVISVIHWSIQVITYHFLIVLPFSHGCWCDSIERICSDICLL